MYSFFCGRVKKSCLCWKEFLTYFIIWLSFYYYKYVLWIEKKMIIKKVSWNYLGRFPTYRADTSDRSCCIHGQCSKACNSKTKRKYRKKRKHIIICWTLYVIWWCFILMEQFHENALKGLQIIQWTGCCDKKKLFISLKRRNSQKCIKKKYESFDLHIIWWCFVFVLSVTKMP